MCVLLVASAAFESAGFDIEVKEVATLGHGVAAAAVFRVGFGSEAVADVQAHPMFVVNSPVGQDPGRSQPAVIVL